MKALILAGGRGKRLRPVTDYIPKPLVTICNVPILEWQIRYLLKFDVRDVVVCTGYKADMIKDRLDAKDFGARINVSVEESPLGTGGAIRQAARYVDDSDTFVVMNGDVITDIDIKRLVRVRNSIAVIPLRTSYGVLELDFVDNDNRGSRVTKFNEKGCIPGMWMNAGIYHLGREILDELPKAGNIEETLFPEYAGTGRLGAVRFGGSPDDHFVWQSVDSLKDLETCKAILGRLRHSSEDLSGA